MRIGERFMRGGSGVRRAGRWTSSWRGGVTLILVCLAVYLPGLAGIGVIDRDEARFAQASRQMLESGDWMIPRVQDRPRLNKPPLIYWIQASAAWVASGGDVRHDAIWMYRIPSVIGAIVTVLLTWRIGVLLFAGSVGWVGALLLAACPLVAFDAHQARADQLLLATTTAAMGALAWAWREWARDHTVRWTTCATLWALVGVGIMSKGPITPLVVGLAAGWLAWCTGGKGWLFALRPLWGLAIVAAIVAPWVVLVAARVGWSDYLRIVYDESLGRVGGSKEGHWGPPGMHLVLIAILFWPGVLATASGVLRGVRVGAPARSPGDVWWKRLLSRRVGRASEAFLVAWLVPAWVFFELFGAKLAHYTMPLYPAVALLTARGLAAYIRARRGRHMDLGERLWLTLGLCITGGVLVLSVLGANARHWAWGPTAGLVGACAGALFMLVAWRAVRRRQLGSAQAWGVIAGGCALGAFFGGPAPKVLPGSETGAIMARVVQAKDWETRPIASEHAEDSMVFFTRGRVERLPPGGGAAWLDAHQNGIVVMRFDPTRDWPTRGHHAVATVPWVGEMGLVRREWWIVEAEGPWIP